MKRYIIAAISILAFAVSMVSCTDHKVIRQLNDVETYINEHPDSALSVLDSISTAGIRGREANAKFALLYSMTLDKNYIDVTDDSLVNIAVEWYRRHGSADERLKSYYYQGRVYQNAGNNETAMQSFVKAEAYAGQSDDKTAAGLLYLAMSNISMNIFDMDKVLEYSSAAENIFKEAGDTLRYSSSLLKISAYYSMQEDYDKESCILDTLAVLWNNMDMQNRNSYFQMKLDLIKETANPDSLSAYLGQYLTVFPEQEINWLSVSEYYLALGEADKALSALQSYEKVDSTYTNDPVYYTYSSVIYDSLGFPDKALDAYKEYVYLADSIDLAIFTQDTKYLSDKYASELRLTQTRNSRTVAVLIGIIVLIAAACAVYTLRKGIRKREAEKALLEDEMSRYRENYARLEKERDELSEMIAGNPPVDRQSMAVLNDRLDLLNKFFTATISGNQKIDAKAQEEVHQLVEDRDMFLYTTRMTFAAAHPDFINFLENRGLSEWQIEYCCLYAIGLKGKEIGSYLNRKRHYNDSSDISVKSSDWTSMTPISEFISGICFAVNSPFLETFPRHVKLCLTSTLKIKCL